MNTLRAITPRRASGALLTLFLASALLATPKAGAASSLPPVGTEIAMSGDAPNVPLQIRTALVTLHFTGGIKVKVDKDPEHPDRSVRLRVTGFRMVAHDLAEGAGTATLELADVDTAPESRLTLNQGSPTTLDSAFVVKDTTLTIEAEGGGEPLVLVNREPFVVTATLRAFPPRGDRYTLRNPVDYVLPDDPDVTVATIQKFPVQFTGL